MCQYRIAKSTNLEQFKKILDHTLKIASLITIHPDDIKNKNLLEAIFIGIAHNLESLNKLSPAEIQIKYELLTKTAPFTSDRKEGLSHTDKVIERLNIAIAAFK